MAAPNPQRLQWVWMAPKQFTLQEAESLLPRLTELLLEIRSTRQEYDHFRQQVENLAQKMRGNGHAMEAEVKDAQTGLERTAAGVNQLLKQASEMGCELKDIDQGLVDFRTEMDGREVYLCWKLPEERIEWWHELDTGFAGRQPLSREAAE